MKKQTISVFLLIALFCTLLSVFSLPVSAETFTGTLGDSLTWTIDLETGLLVIEGSGPIAAKPNTEDTAEEIPDETAEDTPGDTPGGFPWLADAYRTLIKEVHISDGITGIGGGAFWQCTALAAVNIPERVEQIGAGAFGGCTALAHLLIPNSACVIADAADTLGVPGTTHICGPEDSTAQAYAQKYGYAFGHEYSASVTEPTCTEPGATKYTCIHCGDLYEEALLALGHDYQSLVTEPTCTEAGYTTYTCTRCGDSYADTYTDALGHTWAEPVYEWAEDNSAVTASRVCGRDGNHEERETVSTSYQVTRAATEELEGEGVYTAAFANPAFSTQTKTVTIPRLEPVCPFVDVKKSDWFYKAVMWAVKNSITGGVDAQRFGPKKNCTREQVVTFLWAANGSPLPETMGNPFVDVKKSKYYYRPVLWAVEKGITGGVDETHFGVGVSCTRSQVVMFLWAAAGRPEPKAESNPFTDVKKKNYYYKAVLWAVENGITGGTTPTTFSPKTVCSRAQVVTFLYAAYAEKS